MNESELENAEVIVRGRAVAPVLVKGNAGQIIPTYIKAAMPGWFGMLFLLTLLAAAMSTLSSQFHTLGTSIGRDVYETMRGKHADGITVTRVGIMLGVVIAVAISWYARGGTVIARATAIFFGLCGATFLPAYVGGLFWKRMTRAGAAASMGVGFATSAFWLLFVKSKEATAIGLVQVVTGGKSSILEGVANWQVVDPVVIALPLSILTGIVVSLLTRPMDEEHVAWCFGGPRPDAAPGGDESER
jgi:SSS family solute:Na+ symporter